MNRLTDTSPEAERVLIEACRNPHGAGLLGRARQESRP